MSKRKDLDRRRKLADLVRRVPATREGSAMGLEAILVEGRPARQHFADYVVPSLPQTRSWEDLVAAFNAHAGEARFKFDLPRDEPP